MCACRSRWGAPARLIRELRLGKADLAAIETRASSAGLLHVADKPDLPPGYLMRLGEASAHGLAHARYIKIGPQGIYFEPGLDFEGAKLS